MDYIIKILNNILMKTPSFIIIISKLENHRLGNETSLKDSS